MRRKYRLPAALLALCLLLSLAACGRGDAGGDSPAPADLGDTVYTREQVSLPGALEDVTAGCIAGDRAYLADRTGDVRRLWRVDLDGGAEELPGYTPLAYPAGGEGSSRISAVLPGPDGTLWVREQAAYAVYDLPEDFDPETDSKESFLSDTGEQDVYRQLDEDGNELRRADYAQMCLDLGITRSFDGAAPDSAGNLYTRYEDTIHAVDAALRPLFTAEDKDLRSGPFVLGGGVGAWSRRENGLTGETVSRVRELDPERRDWGADLGLPDSAGAVWPGGGRYLFYYEDGGVLWGWDGESGPVALLPFSDLGVPREGIMGLSALEDGRFAVLAERGGGAELAVISPADPDSLPETTVLTYATLQLSGVMQSAVNTFNQSHDNVRIKIKDYAYDPTDNPGAMTQLVTDILAGNVPDILDTESLPIRQLAAKGYLEDLWPWIDADPDLGRENLMLGPLEASEQDGKLYQIFERFTIRFVAGAAQVVGQRTGWTLDELRAALPEGCAVLDAGATKAGVLAEVMPMELDRFVDWETGTCSFAGDEFRALLAFCDSFPLTAGEDGESEDARLLSGRQMLLADGLYRLKDFQTIAARLGGEASFVGWPSGSGGGNCFDIHSHALAMSSACRDKEAAWEFMRRVLTPHWDTTERPESIGGFLINRADFQKQVDYAMTEHLVTYSDGTTVSADGGWFLDGQEVPYHAMTEEEYRSFLALYDSIGRMYSYDEALYGIVEELAGPYFAGDKSLDETCSLIQNRVMLYVNENR